MPLLKKEKQILRHVKVLWGDILVLIIKTERAVFKFKKDGFYLTEIASGVDLEKDVLSLMEFKPKIEGTPKLMDERIFYDKPMGLKK